MALQKYYALLDQLKTAHWPAGKISKFKTFCKKNKLVEDNLIDNGAARKAVIAFEKANQNTTRHAAKNEG